MIKAVIFDLNGTVLSDEDEYGNAFRKVLKSLGKVTDKDYPHVGGIGVKENWQIFLSKYKLKTEKTPDELAHETQKAYIGQIEKITLKKGIEEFIDELKEKEIKIALATANTWWVVEKLFDKHKIEKHFDVVVTTEEVNFNKPSPDIFNAALGKLGINSDEAVVIEDSSAGIEAAHAANIKTVGITRSKEHAKTLKNAELIIKDYTQLSFKIIQDL